MLIASLFTISCSDDDSNNPTNPIETINPKEYKVQLWESSSTEVQYPPTVTY